MATYGNYLYRRNGHFYARLRIPQALEGAYGKTHLRETLNTSDYGDARIRVLETVLSWKRGFLRLQSMLDARQLVAGSALLAGDGLMTLESAARESGLRVEDMLREVINRAVVLRVEASGWQGSDVPAGELEADYDGTTLPDDTLMNRELGAIFGTLYARAGALPLINDGLFTDCVFFRDGAQSRPVVFAFPGISLPAGSLLIERAAADSIRASIAAHVTPAMLSAGADRASRQPPPVSVTSHKHGSLRVSELLTEFFQAKTWSEATKIQMHGMCGVFVELMQDPVLSDIDGVTILRYRERLLTLPRDLYQTRRRLKTTTLAELVLAATGLPLMLDARADAYVAKIGEAFAWASRRGFMPINPAAGAVERKKKIKRAQDDRHEFNDETLLRIFSAPWFKTGSGIRAAGGTYWNFQPHYYWLPLLALMAGGRLNELSQLHLSDIRCTAVGTWYFDFNLDGAGKIAEPDKRLKTVNSIRQVPLHPLLIQLGLTRYVDALRTAGYDRLFPELRFDRVKGYGKQAGQWFNEKYLGDNLKIPRDGKQTFHSFRHNLVTALGRLEPPLSEFVEFR